MNIFQIYRIYVHKMKNKWKIKKGKRKSETKTMEYKQKKTKKYNWETTQKKTIGKQKKSLAITSLLDLAHDYALCKSPAFLRNEGRIGIYALSGTYRSDPRKSSWFADHAWPSVMVSPPTRSWCRFPPTKTHVRSQQARLLQSLA